MYAARLRVAAFRSFARRRALHLALLAALPFVVYSNNYRHDYVLDDLYTIFTNPSVRDLREIPRYFVDPSTFTSSVRALVDYRPVLQVTYALNYRMGVYDTWWWHFTQILLHALATLGIYALCRRILVMIGDPAPHRIALFAAALFAVHPGASEAVNYLNARSALLTAALLLPALLVYMRPIEDPRYSRPVWSATLLFALALLTKVEAIGALGAFWAFELWQRGRESPDRGVWAALATTFDHRTLRRMAPLLAVAAAYLVVRWAVMRDYPFASPRNLAVGPYEYFLTQLTAWWYYLFRWIAPVRLIADYSTYPVYRSWSEPVVLLAVGGWVLVSALLIAAWRRAPYLLFLAIAALALLSPTSSFAPLSDMVNEHRPYLPIGILSLAFLIPAGKLLRGTPLRSVARAVGAGAAVVLVAFAMLTYRRNEVFSTEISYSQDVLAKSPSARAHLGYARALMHANDLDGALRHFQRALDLEPNWYLTHANLAVAYSRVGQMDRARHHYDWSVRLDRFDGLALSRRGEFHLEQGEYEAARDDFMRSLPLSLDRYGNTKGLATAFAGLGDVRRSFEETERMLQLGGAAAVRDIPSVSVPFFRHPALHAAGIEYYQRLNARLPNAPWIRANLANLAQLAQLASAGPPAAGQRSAATGSGAAIPAGPGPAEEALMREGLDLLYDRNEPVAAAAVFRRVLAANPRHYGAHRALAEALDISGHPAEARPLWEEVLRMANEGNDRRIARIAAARLERR